jgi:hypothetical protein
MELKNIKRLRTAEWSGSTASRIEAEATAVRNHTP